MFLFKCCANHAPDSRRSSFSHNNKKRPLQIFIKSSVKSVTQSPKDSKRSVNNVDTDVDYRINGKIENHCDIDDGYSALLASDRITKIDNHTKQSIANDDGNLAHYDLEHDDTTELSNRVEQCLRTSSEPIISPSKISKHRNSAPCAYSRIGVSDRAINKNHHHLTHHHRHRYGSPVTNNCIALLIGDNKVVTSIVKNKKLDPNSPGFVTKYLPPDGSVNSSEIDRGPRLCSFTRYSLNDLFEKSSLTKFNHPDTSENSDLFSYIQTPDIDNHVEIVYRCRNIIRLKYDDYRSVLSLDCNHSPILQNQKDLTLSASSKLLYPEQLHPEGALENTDKNSVPTLIGAAKSSSPPTTCYSSFESDFCHTTVSSPDFTSTSTPTRNSSTSHDDFYSYDYKPCTFSLLNSFELINNEDDIDFLNKNDNAVDEHISCDDYIVVDATTTISDKCDYEDNNVDDISTLSGTNNESNQTDIRLKQDYVEYIPNNTSHNFNLIDLEKCNEVKDEDDDRFLKEHEQNEESLSDDSRPPLITDSNLETSTDYIDVNGIGIELLMNEDSTSYLDCIFPPEINIQCDNCQLLSLESTEMEVDDEDDDDDEDRPRPIFTSSDWNDDARDEGDADNDILNDDQYPTFDPMEMQPQTRELESYFISESSSDKEIHTVCSPGTNVRKVVLYNYKKETENNKGVCDSISNSDSMKSIKSLHLSLSDKMKQKSFHETDDRYRTKNNSILDFQRFYSKSTPNLNSDVDKRQSSLTLIEEYFSKYIIDCETNEDDEETNHVDINEGSNVDPNVCYLLSPQETSSVPFNSPNTDEEIISTQTLENQPLDKFSEICKKFSSTCLNIFQTSYPSLHTTSDSCPAISNLNLDADQLECDNMKGHSQSAATLSALYAAIFPTLGSPDDAQEISESPSNNLLSKETSVDDQFLIGNNEQAYKKPALVRRCLSLKAPETTVQTKEVRKKKKVKFADAFGLELAIVRLILSGENLSDQAFQQRFQAASVSYQSNINNQINSCNAHKCSTSRSSCLKNSNEKLKVKPDDAQTQASPTKKIIADFIQPGNSEDFSTKVWLQNVVLESCLAEKKSNSISGCIRVYNLTYGKEVIVRYTMNNWVTYSEHKASYIYGSNDGNSDRFSFFINLPPYFDVGSIFEFAILYRTSDGREFWDNNHGHNYRMICQKC